MEGLGELKFQTDVKQPNSKQMWLILRGLRWRLMQLQWEELAVKNK